MRFPYFLAAAIVCVLRATFLASILIPAQIALAQVPAPAHTGVGSQGKLPTSVPDVAGWRGRMAATKLPSPGCFKATYPDGQWTSVPCAAPPARTPIPPPRPQPGKGVHPLIVGNGNDVVASAAGGRITSVEGSFPNIYNLQNVTSVGYGPPAPGAFGLQLNTESFNSPACASSMTGNCVAWQQFLYMIDKNAAWVLMEYWLLGYGSPCPGTSGRPQVPGMPAGLKWISTGSDCMFDSYSMALKSENINDLAKLSLLASADNGANDSVVATGTDNSHFIYGVSLPDSILNLASAWGEAEFNVVGFVGGAQAVFNPHAAAIVRVNVQNGTANPPGVLGAGFTGESNNLNLAGQRCSFGGNVPHIIFGEASEPSLISNTCPPAIDPPPPPTNNACQQSESAVKTAQEQLQEAVKARSTEACTGQALYSCQMRVNQAQQALVAANNYMKKVCGQ